MRLKIYLTILMGAAMIMNSGLSVAGKSKPQGPLTLDKMISAADELMRTQATMSWNNRIKGTPVDFESTYKGYEWLFTPDAIKFVDEKMNEPGISPDEKRARTYFKDYLVEQHVGREVVSLDDKLTNTESKTTVKVPWLKKEVAYREIPIVMAKENDAKKRKELQLLTAEVQREKLNPIVAERDAKAHEIIKSLGYKSYLDFSLEARNVKDFKKIIRDADNFGKKTDSIYKTLLAEHAKDLLNMKVEDMRRSDLQKIFRLDTYVSYFPADAMVPFLKYFLADIGLDFTTADGHQILLDDEQRPKKNPRAACYNIVVPSDIRMTIAPQGGIGDFTPLFHETGHAEHFANTTVPEWAFKYLGDYAATEAYAGLFEGRFSDPDFLRYYRDFIVEWNKKQPADKKVPVLTDVDIAKLVRFALFNDLYFMRRYGGAKLVYESAYHGDDPKWWAGIYNGQSTDKREMYRTLFEKAYGFPMEATDSERYLTDIDEFLYAVDYVRSFVLATQIDDTLSEKFGGKWHENKDVGKFLKDKLFFAGDKLTADEVADILGYKTIDFDVYERDIRARLAASEKLLSNSKK